MWQAVHDAGGLQRHHSSRMTQSLMHTGVTGQTVTHPRIRTHFLRSQVDLITQWCGVKQVHGPIIRYRLTMKMWPLMEVCTCNIIYDIMFYFITPIQFMSLAPYRWCDMWLSIIKICFLHRTQLHNKQCNNIRRSYFHYRWYKCSKSKNCRVLVAPATSSPLGVQALKLLSV